MEKLTEIIKEKILEFEQPKRQALSNKFPKFKKPIIFTRQILRKFNNFFNYQISYKTKNDFYNHVIARHQSVLIRKLGETDVKLQRQKVTNLQIAVKKLNGVIILPEKIFSLWSIIGRPTEDKGYVKGMLLSNGNVLEGIGGGLCQLSNFLFWIFLHTDIKIIERHHHSMDVFPDSSRTLPFGSGSTILFNFIDLKVKNISPYALQLKIWLTDKHLKGQLLSQKNCEKKFHLFEKNHYFIKRTNKYFRYNEIWRTTSIQGKKIKEEKIVTNFAPVLYKVNSKYLEKNNYKVINF